MPIEYIPYRLETIQTHTYLVEKLMILFASELELLELIYSNEN